MENKKAPTWAHLRAFANMLTEEQLAQPVRFWGEETGGTASGMECLPEDFINDGESFSPKSSYESDLLEQMEKDDEIEEVMPKGTPMIYMD